MLTRGRGIGSSRMMRSIDKIIKTALRQNIKILNTAILGEKVALLTLSLWGMLSIARAYSEYRVLDVK